MAQHEVVFEDLHGVREDKGVTVDLDADSKDKGITRTPAEQAADRGGSGNDDIQFDDLPGARRAAPTKDDDKGGASRDSGDDQYSKKVKARIARATKAEKQAKQEASYWEQQARKLAKDQATRDKQTYERTIEQAGSAIEQAQADLEKAIEDGDTKGQVRLTSRLTDLKADKLMAESSLNDLPPDGNVQPFSGKVDASSDKTSTKADDWMDERSDWYGAKGFERQTRLANRLDKEVFNDGFDPNTEEYFEELDKRIKAKAPELYDDDSGDDDTDDGQEQTGGRKRSPVAGVGGQENSRGRRSSSKVELNEDDFANMRFFGLDPNDPEVLKEYARNKREVEMQEE